jgi:dCTP deaminase
MTVLSDASIQKLIDDGKLVIDPLDKFLIDTTSVDIRIGNKFYDIKKMDITYDPVIDFNISEYLEEKQISDHIMLKPGEFKIVETLERFKIPKDLVGTIIQRQSGSITGIRISGVIHPGSEGHQKLYIKNEGPWNIIIRPGCILCQIIFSKTEEPALKTYIDENVKVILRKRDQVNAMEQNVRNREKEVNKSVQDVKKISASLVKKIAELDDEKSQIETMKNSLKSKTDDIDNEYDKVDIIKKELEEEKAELDRLKEELAKKEKELKLERKKLEKFKSTMDRHGKTPTRRPSISSKFIMLEETFKNLPYSPITVYGYKVSRPENFCYSFIRQGLMKFSTDQCIIFLDSTTPQEAHNYMARICENIDIYERKQNISYVRLSTDVNTETQTSTDQSSYLIENINFDSLKQFMFDKIDQGKSMRFVLPLNRLYKRIKKDDFLNFIDELCEKVRKKDVMIFLIADPKLKRDYEIDKYTNVTLDLDKNKKRVNVTGIDVSSSSDSESIIKYRIERGIFTIIRYQKTL